MPPLSFYVYGTRSEPGRCPAFSGLAEAGPGTTYPVNSDTGDKMHRFITYLVYPDCHQAIFRFGFLCAASQFIPVRPLPLKDERLCLIIGFVWCMDNDCNHLWHRRSQMFTL